MCDPSSVSAVDHGSARTTGVANKAVEQRKLASYAGVEGLVANGNFIPFAVETTGRVGPWARSWLESLIGDGPKEELRSLYRRIGQVVMAYNGRLIRCLRQSAVQHHASVPLPSRVPRPLVNRSA